MSIATCLLAHEHNFWLWLFEQRAAENLALSITSDIETRKSRDGNLFDWDEAFVPSCCLNESFCGRFVGQWTPKIAFLGLEPDERLKD